VAMRTKRCRRQQCLDITEDSDLVFADGYDKAIIGIAYREGHPLVVYDTNTILRILIKRDGMWIDEAEEFFYYNIQGAFVGPRTPLFLDRVR
jgi:hypothetical protein